MSPESAQAFRASELRTYLAAIDEHLHRKTTITILGGSAIALYGAEYGTTDIDTYATNVEALESAIARAQEETGLRIPISNPGVSDVPHDYEDRLAEVEGDWRSGSASG